MERDRRASRRRPSGCGSAPAVTCPTIRIHPAIIAQAAATTAAMMPGRFFLGVGTGENLNEHVVGRRLAGGRRAPGDARGGRSRSSACSGRAATRATTADHYTVENARLYTLPDEPPPIVVAARKPKAAELAGRLGDAFINTAPDEELARAFERRRRRRASRKYGQITVCWAKDEDEARQDGARDLAERRRSAATSAHGAAAPAPLRAGDASRCTEETVGEAIPCGPDAERHVEDSGSTSEAGYTHVYVHQIGPDQEGFFHFFEQDLSPRLGV